MVNTFDKIHPNINYGLWVTMYQCKFISSNKCTTLVWNIDSGEGKRNMWELSVLSVQFCYELKTALKNKVFFKRWMA